MFTHKPKRITGERSIPLLSEFATYCTLADILGGLKGRGRRLGSEKRFIRHATGRRARIDIGQDVVEDRRWLASCDYRVILVGTVWSGSARPVRKPRAP